MKVLFLTMEASRPSSRIRVYNLLPELKKAGIDSLICLHAGGLSQRLNLWRLCRTVDIVVVQKRLLSSMDRLLLRHLSSKLVFDFDDAIYCRKEDNVIRRNTKYYKFKEMIRCADLIIAGNKVLADVASLYSKEVIIIPSAVTVGKVPAKIAQSQGGKCVIGWVGVPGNLVHLIAIGSVLKRLSNEHAIELRIISSKNIDIPGVDVRFVPWCLERQDDEIAKFDIGIMPLPDTPFTAGKCGYKALQYMAAGVPPVVSNVGANGDIIDHGVDGLLAENDEAFYAALKSLIVDVKLRAKLGANALRKIQCVYAVEPVGKKLAQSLRALIS